MKDRDFIRSTLVLFGVAAGAAFGLKSAAAQPLPFLENDCSSNSTAVQRPFILEAVLPPKVNLKEESIVEIRS